MQAMQAPEKPRLVDILLNRRMLICIFIGFSSGLPLYLLIQLIPAWLRSEHVDLKSIGLFALVQFPYTWKFLWAPLMDSYSLPGLGRRRGWMALTQLGLLASIPLFGVLHPTLDLTMIVYLAAVVAFLSASQDIVLDGYRRELLPDIELGLGSAIYVNAYKLSSLVPGSLALILSDFMSWQSVFCITSLFMLPGLAMTWFIDEPQTRGTPKTLQEAVVLPFREFITDRGWRMTLLVLAFVFFYKIGDSMATALATPFYLDLGFTRTDIGLVAKHASLWPSIIGGMLGGLWMVRLGINKSLWLFGVAQLLAILGFAWLSGQGPDKASLALAISLEAFGTGLGTAALTAYIARSCDPRYAATQFALLTALAAVPRVFVNAGTGYLVDYTGWFSFFLLCTVMALPGMLLLVYVAPWRNEAA